jgi:transcription antitermination factor NusG
LHVYLPEVRNKVQRCDRRSCRPFFPYYLFLRDPGLAQLLQARWAPGLRRIIAYGGRPAMIPDQVIRQIQTRLGTFEFPEDQPFKRGQVVRIVGGPF